MSLLDIYHLSHTYGDRVLYKDAELSLHRGEHMGVVGPNGAGKSTLIKICTGQVIPDEGRVVWHRGTAVGYLDQYAQIGGDPTIDAFLHAAFADLYALEEKLQQLSARFAVGEDVWEQAERCQQRLEAADFYGIDTAVEKAATGLGLTAIGLNTPISQLSGGQRAKVLLCKLLLTRPDVLLLDEPTNFLDEQHIDWLAGYLQGLEAAFMVVSHDSTFLQRVTSCICDVDGGTLRKYVGSYHAFLDQKQHLHQDYVRRYQAQQQHIQKTEAFIRKNIAGNNSKIAKGRRRQLEHLERLAPPSGSLTPPAFDFCPLPAAAQLLQTNDLAVGYQFPLFSHLRLAVAAGQKVVVTGFNGAGKSTLLKTLIGQLPPLHGRCRLSDTAVWGYYAQDIGWDDGNRTPLQVVQDGFACLKEKEARRQLARCGITNDHISQPVNTLSGGEQAKVKLCLLTLKPCNLLVLDEPTNHLDADATQALSRALQNFDGAVLLVCHEPRFYRPWADRVLDVAALRQ